MPWKPGMEDLEWTKSSAVWIRLKNIPVHCWSQYILFSLANAIGRLTNMDATPASQKILSFAGIQVDLDLLKPKLSLIWMEVENESPVAIDLVSENLPCNKCILPGHTSLHCKEPLLPNANR